MTADYTPGDVVHIPEGPFQGMCAVVRAVDVDTARLQVHAVGRGGGAELSLRFDEVEWA
ncbi:hypothetical protein [Nocardia camponoti]|uniref:hypothetical protein n=1 Tax=Nocardia camponoti TaxID=1616106 RepID=UPI0016674462|nr:hypothetical protein [Nocardia camponoti]